MATQVIGDIAINNLVPIASHGAGVLAFGPVALPAGYSVLTVVFDLQQVTTLTPVFTATVQLSLDNGATWADVGGVGLDLSKSGYVLASGVITRNASDALGPGPVRDFAAQVQLPRTELTTRQIQGTVTCSAAVISGVTITAF